MQPSDVLEFWFSTLTPEQWYRKDEAVDAQIRTRFEALHVRARAGACDGWMAEPRGAIALVITLDQFPRNMFRGHPDSFAADAKAREVARFIVDQGWDREMSEHERMFCYMPFEHSETVADQERCVSLFRNLGGEPRLLEYALAHHRIVARFGRFPHRNEVLGRASSDEEIAFLEEPGSSF